MSDDMKDLAKMQKDESEQEIEKLERKHQREIRRYENWLQKGSQVNPIEIQEVIDEIKEEYEKEIILLKDLRASENKKYIQQKKNIEGKGQHISCFNYRRIEFHNNFLISFF